MTAVKSDLSELRPVNVNHVVMVTVSRVSTEGQIVVGQTETHVGTLQSYSIRPNEYQINLEGGVKIFVNRKKHIFDLLVIN